MPKESGAGESLRAYNMMVRLRDDERARVERCLERYNRQRALDRMRLLRSQSEFVRYAIDRLCEKVEAGDRDYRSTEYAE